MALEPRPILDMNAFVPERDGRNATEGLLNRRQRNFGAASVLFYRRPIEMRRGEGCWMQSADGTWYLDFYNNVPSVGHCHPHVVEAVSRQMADLNVNSRYLHAETELYLERLKATLPNDIENIVMTCSGSEANDLALRIAKKSSGGTGFVVTETAYHGNTAAVTEISPSSCKQSGEPPAHVVTIPAPGTASFGDDIAGGFEAAIAEAIETLNRRGYPIAALICDTIFSSDGVFADPPRFLAPAVALVRDRGGIFIADEVQPGFARTGEAFWGFARHDVKPDIVTMGKPMGNGFPMAATATRPEMLAAFCEDVGYFNTFGGTPVAAAAGLAVLEAIEAEGLQANALTVGRRLRDRLDGLSAIEPRIGEVRGAGLFLGVDLCRLEDGLPDPELAADVINGLRERQVLIGAAGRFGHTLKVRPPLCLREADADLFADALADTLAHLPI